MSSKAILKQLKWMDIKSRHTFIGIFMFKVLNSLLPPSLKDAFCLVKNTHKYSTRASVTNKLSLSNVRTDFLKRTLLFNGPSVWNLLPETLRDSTCLHAFKKSLKLIFYLS